MNANEALLRDIAGLVKASRDDVEDKVRQLVERSRKLERERFLPFVDRGISHHRRSDSARCRAKMPLVRNDELN